MATSRVSLKRLAGITCFIGTEICVVTWIWQGDWRWGATSVLSLLTAILLFGSADNEISKFGKNTPKIEEDPYELD